MSDLYRKARIALAYPDETPLTPVQALHVARVASVLLEEGDSRAAEMRDRCARWLEAQYVQPTAAPLMAAAADAIRALPLSPAEEKPNAD